MPVSKPKGKKRKPRQRPPEYDFDEPVEFVEQFASPLDAIVERLKNVAQATDRFKSSQRMSWLFQVSLSTLRHLALGPCPGKLRLSTLDQIHGTLHIQPRLIHYV